MASNSDQLNFQAVVFHDFVPEGLPELGKHWKLENRTIDLTSLKDGDVVFKIVVISVDPYMRSRMKDIKSYFPGFTKGKAGDGGAVGTVYKSKNPNFKEGDSYVCGLAGFSWQEYQLVSDEKFLSTLHKLPETIPSLTLAVGTLGMPGVTAYGGLLYITEPKEGETVVVSGAAGAVGHIVVQLAKIAGCRVVGIAGSEAKLKWLKELGADATINYKTTDDMTNAIKEAAPKGVDVYFDNVGGAIKDATFANLNSRSRVSCCGAISSYNLKDAPKSQSHEWTIITKEVRVEGFICSRWMSEWAEIVGKLGKYIGEGKLKYKETTKQGIENVIPAFNAMLNGENIGKMAVTL